MSAPPKTVLVATPEEEAAIRAAVRRAEGKIVAGPEHVDGLLALFSDPRVSDPLYDLPRPFTRENVAKWVADNEALRQEGRCILAVNLDDAGVVSGFSRFTVWPERSSAELSGGRRADLQNTGAGRVGVAQSVAWMFEELGVRLIELTAALDNIRSAKAIDGAGFTRMGEVESVRPDGTVRRSLYWEMTRDEWRRRHVL
ncbi:MAG TPA: GNAT family protein [Phenylobacterium sp.]|nr:GNAT family protein [Phenylobacterium sp.]